MNGSYGKYATAGIIGEINLLFFRQPAICFGAHAMLLPIAFADATHHQAGRVVAEHAHQEGQLLLVLSGTATVTAEEGFWLTPPGFGVWIPANCEHGAIYSETSSLINLRFAPALCAALSATCELVQVTDLLRELAHEVVRLQPARDEVPTLNLMAQLMVHQARRPWRGSGLFVPHGRDRRLRGAINRVRADPGANFQLDELARQSATSGRTLARLFAHETGMSFRRWLEYFRVVCAIDRLAQGQAITETALELGYQSASSFTTLFTRVLGHPPKRYMQLLAARRLQSNAGSAAMPP
jgi:AraC-like DNA-binding protein